MAGLTFYGDMQKKPPVAQEESVLHVSAREVEPGDYPVVITGFGQATALREAAIAPEISGTVDRVFQGLAAGNSVEEGDVLFRIRPASYVAQVAEARAAVAQQESALARIGEEEAIERARLTSLNRTLALAREEFERAQELRDSGVGAKSGEDLAERAMLEAESQRDVTSRSLDVYPLRVREAEALLERARAQLSLAELNLARTEVRAPFAGRIKSESVENGQFISAGTLAVVIADDRLLEIEVPIDAREARDWMRFQERDKNSNWFAAPEQVECAIRWTEDESGTTWPGTLDRVSKYDPQSRMLHVVVQYDPSASSNGDAFPIADGLFCEVEIPGRPMEDVYRIETEAVSYDNTLYVAEDNRLRTRNVEVLRESGSYAYINAGLSPGDTVVVTRLVDVLENSLLDVHLDTDAAADAPAAAAE